MRKIILLFILFYSYLFFGQSNSIDNTRYFFRNFPNSPSTATFLRYGDIQNAEFTGTNTPKIPIYTVKEGEITLPLTLDYISGNGIKVADEATSVGLGWNIGLPTITQSVLGYDDFDLEEVYTNLQFDLHHQPNAPWPTMNYNNKYLEPNEIDQPLGYIDQPMRGKYSYYFSSHYSFPVNGVFHRYPNWNKYDTSPDIFTLNLNGEKIQFIITNFKDLTSGVVPQFTCLKGKGYKISYENLKFIVVSPAGLTYEFGRSENIKIYDIIARNFVLTMIKDVNNNYIYLNYDEINNIINFIPFSNNLNYTTASSYTPNFCEGIPTFWGGMYVSSTKLLMGNTQNISNIQFPYYGGSAGTFTIPTTSHSSTSQNYLLISGISGNFGHIGFGYSNRDDSPLKKLSGIGIAHSSNQPSDITIEFNYEYFEAQNSLNNSNFLKKRLKLKTLTVNNSEKYEFEYFENNPLPAKNSFAVDYWGYYNGGDSNQTYYVNPNDFNLNAYNVPITNLNNNKKNADIQYCKSGVLKRIIYPTKGYSIFDYELNSADNLFINEFNPKLSLGKGLRLKSQINYDWNNDIESQTLFSYENGHSTNPLDLIRFYSGKRFSEGNSIYQYGIISFNPTNSYSASPLSSGDYVGYENVHKVQKNNLSLTNGKISTLYSFSPDVYYRFYDDQSQINMPATQSEGIENGKVLNEKIFDKNNHLLKSIENQYTTLFSPTFHGTSQSMLSEALFVCFTISNGTSPNAHPDWLVDLSAVGYYPIFSKESLLTHTRQMEYFNNDLITTKTDFSYDPIYNLITNKTTTTPSNDILSENFQYSYMINRLKEKNIFNKIIGSNKYKNNVPLPWVSVKFDDQSHYNPTSETLFEINNPNVNPVPLVTYDQYDSKGNLQQYTTKTGIPVTIIWGYNHTKPIAKIEGATYAQVQNIATAIITASDTDAIASAGNDEASFLALLDTFRKDLANYQITTYTYDPLIGVRTITPPSGIIEYYIYDPSNRLQKIIDINNKVLKEFTYNYSPSRFYSQSQSQTFVKNNCPSGYFGNQYMYIVPEYQFFSVNNQAEADQQAQNDINTNGQTTTNTNGTCTQMSCSVTKGTGINNLFYGSISLLDSYNFKIQMGFPFDSSLNWSSGVLIGKINGNCLVSQNSRSSSCYYNGIWSITISTNGDILAKLSSQSPSLSNGMTVNLNFSFPIY